jgi:hypothetical protein
MRIEISHRYLNDLRNAIKQLKIRHGPFIKMSNTYNTRIYPSNKNSFFLLKMSETDLIIKSEE